MVMGLLSTLRRSGPPMLSGAALRLTLLGAGLVSAGCEPLYDADWPGEPLLEVEGTAEAGEEPAVDEARAAMLWLSASPYGLALEADDVPIETAFPARWTVTVHAVPDDAQFPGRWEDVPFLPEAPDVRTLFGVLVAYEDTDADGLPDFDYSGYGLLDWLADPQGDEVGGLIGGDRLLGLAHEFVVIAAELDGERLGDVVDLTGSTTAAALADVVPGLHTYAFDGTAWVLEEPALDVLLQLR